MTEQQFLNVLSVPSSHARASSFKNRPRPKLSLKIDTRPRSDSLPQIFLINDDTLNERNVGHGESGGGGLCRVRSFKKTSKGVINIGDKFKNKSTISLKSSGSVKNVGADRKTSVSSSGARSDVSNTVTYYRVMVLGSDGVGKSTLIRQFMSSECTGPYEVKTPVGDPTDVETTVSVLLDDSESSLEFVDDALVGEIDSVKPDSFLVVFSLTDIITFEMAKTLIRHIRVEVGNDRSIILVANKTDLVRKRHISQHDAIAIATKYDCKYVEISIALNHRVDDLIVGILSQIRLRLNPTKIHKKHSKLSKPKRVLTNMFSKLFNVALNSDTQKCEDLFT